MPLEVGEDVFDRKRIPQGKLQGRLATSIVLRVVEHGRGRKQAIEDPVGRVVDGLHISHAAIVGNRKVRNVARGTTNSVEDATSVFGHGVLLAVPWLEIVEKVKLEIVHERWINL